MRKLGLVLVLILVTAAVGCLQKGGVVILPNQQASNTTSSTNSTMANITTDNSTSKPVVNDSNVVTLPYEPGPNNETA